MHLVKLKANTKRKGIIAKLICQKKVIKNDQCNLKEDRKAKEWNTK